MDYIPYFMLKLLNNTQNLNFTKAKVFHIHIHISDLLLVMLAVWNMYFTCYMTPDLTVLWYPNCYLVTPFLCIRNIRKIILTCLPLPLLYYLLLIIWNLQTKTKYFHLEILNGWRKLLVYLAGVFTKKDLERLFNISTLVLSL